MDASKLTMIECKDCGDTFSITENEKKWYEDKGFELPKRCPDCRKKRKDDRRGKKN